MFVVCLSHGAGLFVCLSLGLVRKEKNGTTVKFDHDVISIFSFLKSRIPLCKSTKLSVFAVRVRSRGCLTAHKHNGNVLFAETMTARSGSSLEGSWTELKGEKCGRVSVGDMGDWEQHTRGIGMKLLLKMGYRMGEGLGRRSDGIVHAIQPVMFPKSWLFLIPLLKSHQI